MTYGLRRFEEYALEPAEGMARLHCEWTSEASGLEIYVRRSIRWKGVITLANITLPRHLQQQGIFTRFCEDWKPRLPLFIEHVGNPDLDRWLNRTGWYLYDLDGHNGYYNDLASAIIDRRFK